jgi:hypothetical protein
MLQIDLISLSQGSHYLEFGLNADELCDFKIQMWITKYGKRAVDWLQHLSLGWISFMGGDLWIMNQPESLVDRCNLFGEQKDCYVGITANEEPNTIKILDSIGIHTDGEWEVTSVIIPKTLNYPNGMSSKIPSVWFKKREGILRAEFLRNMKSVSDTEDILELLRGESLRGYAAYILLKNTQTTQFKLYKVDINMTKSRI